MIGGRLANRAGLRSAGKVGIVLPGGVDIYQGGGVKAEEAVSNQNIEIVASEGRLVSGDATLSVVEADEGNRSVGLEVDGGGKGGGVEGEGVSATSDERDQ